MNSRHYPGSLDIAPIVRHLSWDLNSSSLRAEVIGERAVFIRRGTSETDCCLGLLFTPLEGGLQVSMERSEARWFNLVCSAIGGVAALALEAVLRRETRLGRIGWVSAFSLARQIPRTLQSILLERRVWQIIDQGVSFQTRLKKEMVCSYCGGTHTSASGCVNCGAPGDKATKG